PHPPTSPLFPYTTLFRSPSTVPTSSLRAARDRTFTRSTGTGPGCCNSPRRTSRSSTLPGGRSFGNDGDVRSNLARATIVGRWPCLVARRIVSPDALRPLREPAPGRRSVLYELRRRRTGPGVCPRDVAGRRGGREAHAPA